MRKTIAIILVLLVAATRLCAQLPEATLMNLEGQQVSTSQINNDGKPFVISFFATWCKPCMRELSTIQPLYNQWRVQTGVKYFAVMADPSTSIQTLKQIIAQNGFKYEFLIDTTGDFAQAMHVRGIPHVILCDGNGKIIYTHVGFRDGDEKELYTRIKQAAGSLKK